MAGSMTSIDTRIAEILDSIAGNGFMIDEEAAA